MPFSFLIGNLRALTLEPKGGKRLLQYIMFNLLSPLQQDVLETCHVARLSKGPDNYVTLAPFETAT